VTELARRLAGHGAEVVCGPLVEGAFVALTVAAELGAELAYTERFDRCERAALFPIEYRLPGALREQVRGRRVAVMDDVISAGSAVRGTAADLRACGAEPVVINSLLVLGDAAERFSAAEGLPLERLARRESNLWEPAACPLCAAGVPVEDLSH